MRYIILLIVSINLISCGPAHWKNKKEKQIEPMGYIHLHF